MSKLRRIGRDVIDERGRLVATWLKGVWYRPAEGKTGPEMVTVDEPALLAQIQEAPATGDRSPVG